MKWGLFLLALSTVSVLANAQQKDSKSILIEELNKGSAKVPKTKRQAVKIQRNDIIEIPEAAAAPATSTEVAEAFIQAQPQIVVEETPLKESRADLLRKKRVEKEQETEQRIVERLEDERMKAEEERANKLLGNLNQAAPAPVAPVAPQTTPSAFDAVQSYPEQPSAAAPAPVAAPVAVQPPVAQPVVVQAAPSENDEVDAGKDLSLKEELDDLHTEAPSTASKFFISGIAGVANYASVKNVKGVYAAGVGGGVMFEDGLSFEASFLMSSYDVEQQSYYYSLYPTITELQQKNMNAGVKYRVLKNKVSPTVGALASYTLREYSNLQYPVGFPFTASYSASSQAFDMGLSAGADLRLSDSFEVGVDLKYFFNLTYRIDSKYQTSFVNPMRDETPIEKLNYYVFGVNMKVLF